jgi:hypothetical protein
MARCMDCQFYPIDCAYWDRKPKSNEGRVNEKTVHNCPDFQEVQK